MRADSGALLSFLERIWPVFLRQLRAEVEGDYVIQREGPMPWGRIYHPANEQSNLLNALADKTCTQPLAAGMYADCIRADVLAKRAGKPGCDFKVINAAVAARWPRGLTRVKTLAWKELEVPR